MVVELFVKIYFKNNQKSGDANSTPSVFLNF